MTIGTFPDELAVLVLTDLYLAVVAASLTEIALGVKLGVHYVVVNEFHHAEDCVKIVLHIGHLNVGDRAAGRELLELCLKLELLKRVDRLGYVNVIGVGNVILIGYALDYAKSLLQAFCKLVGRRLKGRAVKRVVNILRRLPLCRVGVEKLHYLKSESLALGLGKLLTRERKHALPKTRVAER